MMMLRPTASAILLWFALMLLTRNVESKSSSPWTDGWTNPYLFDLAGHSQADASASEPLMQNFDSKLRDMEASLPSSRPQTMQWSQDLIEDNGGTVLALAGADFCILATDTRLSSEYRIRTRNVSRILEVSPQTYIGMAGSWADVITLRRELAYETSQFRSIHGPISTGAQGRFLSNRLYLHRLQPIYALNIVAGLDDQGRGSIYSYDVIGSFNRVSAACCGRGQELMQPVLDQFTDKKSRSMNDKTGDGTTLSLSCDDALAIVKDAFLSGAEREISIGDSVEIVVMKKGEEPYVQRIPLPRH